MPLCHTSRMETTAAPSMLPHLWKSALLSGHSRRRFSASLVLAWPGITIFVAAIFFGAYLLVTGIVAGGLRVQPACLGRRPGTALHQRRGRADPGGAVLPQPAGVDLLLAIWIGIGFIFRGVATAVSAISDPTLPGRGWEIFIGVISLIAGVVMLAAPFESLATLTMVVGIWLIVIGVFEVMSAFGIRSAQEGHRAHLQETVALRRPD